MNPRDELDLALVHLEVVLHTGLLLVGARTGEEDTDDSTPRPLG